MKPRKTEHPILFSTVMVQAILALIKLMTRRTKGLEIINKLPIVSMAVTGNAIKLQ